MTPPPGQIATWIGGPPETVTQSLLSELDSMVRESHDIESRDNTHADEDMILANQNVFWSEFPDRCRDHLRFDADLLRVGEFGLMCRNERPARINQCLLIHRLQFVNPVCAIEPGHRKDQKGDADDCRGNESNGRESLHAAKESKGLLVLRPTDEVVAGEQSVILDNLATIPGRISGPVLIDENGTD